MTDIWEPQTVSKSGSRSRPTPATPSRKSASSQGSAKAIWEKAGNVTFDVARIDEIERVTKHDVIAFLTISPNSSALTRVSCIRA